MTTSKELLNLLAEAAKAHDQFHFCKGYYNIHTPKGCSIATSLVNKEKNKLNHWGFPYDHNLITSIPHYINASPMRFNEHQYIAAQGPRRSTFSEFWNMVVEEKSSLIISVTNERESPRGDLIDFKFDRFWPNSGFEIYGDVTVMLHEEQLAQEWNDGRKEKIRRRLYEVKKGDQSRTISHLHMENWPDNGVVQPDSLIKLSEQADKNFNSGPIIVHCAAGVGRTGTFIAYHSLFHDHRQKRELDITGRIHEMRRLRWGAMISDIKQYELLIEALKISLGDI